jgi:hypothetical protein
MSRIRYKRELSLFTACSCCDHITVQNRARNEVCPVCFWEDDGTELNQPNEPSASNENLTLRDARLNFKELGCCNVRWLTRVCTVNERAEYVHRPKHFVFSIFQLAEAARKHGIAVTPYGGPCDQCELDEELIAYRESRDKRGFLVYGIATGGYIAKDWLDAVCQPAKSEQFLSEVVEIAAVLGIFIELGSSESYNVQGQWTRTSLSIEQPTKLTARGKRALKNAKLSGICRD